MLYKLDKATGAQVSKVNVGYMTYSPVYADGDMVYVYARDHNVYALDTAKGEISWKFSSFIK
jgi:outer membrane protein assembly factor BamB